MLKMNNGVRGRIILARLVAAGLAAAGALLMIGCGEDDKKEEAAAEPATLTFADIKPIVETNCAKSGCHVAGTGVSDLSTEAGLKANQVAVLERIALVPGNSANTKTPMPPSTVYSGTTAWDQTADGANLKAYLYLEALK